jgi:hypothetical protein
MFQINLLLTSSTLKIVAARSSGMYLQIYMGHTSDEHNLNIHCCVNPKYSGDHIKELDETWSGVG